MQDVADDGHREVLERALVAADGQHVEHALGRVRVAAVTAVDHGDGRADVFGDEVGGTGVGMAHDEDVGGHGFQVAHGVEQGFALAGRGGRHVQGDHVGRQVFRRQFEGGARAGRVLEEHVAHRPSLQVVTATDSAGIVGEEGVGRVENFGQQFAGQAVEREKVAQLAQIIELQRALGVSQRHRGVLVISGGTQQVLRISGQFYLQGGGSDRAQIRVGLRA